MMEIPTLINAISSIVIAVSMSAFLIFVYGKSGLMDKLPIYESYIVKVGLTSIACGGLFNFMIMSTPPWSEIVLNVGLAITFSWAAIFHYIHFVKKP